MFFLSFPPSLPPSLPPYRKDAALSLIPFSSISSAPLTSPVLSNKNAVASTNEEEEEEGREEGREGGREE